MVYTPPTTRDTGDFITAPIYNVDLVNNLIALKALIDALDTTVSQNSTSITNNTSTLTNQTLNIGSRSFNRRRNRVGVS